MSIYNNLHTYLSLVDENKLNNALGLDDHCCNLTVEKLMDTVSQEKITKHEGLTFKGHSHSQATKQKMSASISKAMKNNPNARSKNQKGVLNPFYGKKHSDASRAKMSEKRKGKTSGAKDRTWKRSEYTNSKLSTTCTGRKKFIREDGSWTWVYPKK